MVALLDTTVLLDFIGDSADERHSAGHVMDGAASSRFEPTVALQSLQELIYVRGRRGHDAGETLEYSKWIGRTFRVLSHEAEDLEVILGLMTEHPSLGSSDAMIYASGMRAGVDSVVTRDKNFGRAVGDGWVDPMDPESLQRLIGEQ